MKAAKNEAKRLTTMELAIRYGISVKLIDVWKQYEGFPRHAAIRMGQHSLWDHKPVDEWLRGRLAKKAGPKPRWAEIVEPQRRSA